MSRREFGKGMLAGAALLAIGEAIPAMAHEAPIIRDTYMREAADKQQALPIGQALFEKLKANNPNLKPTLDDHELSYGFVGGGPRKEPRIAYGAYIVHAKGVQFDDERIGIIGGSKRLPTVDELESRYPDVLAVIPAEKEITYERFKDFYNVYVIKLRAEK